MKIGIYSQNGDLRVTVSPSDSSTQTKEIGGDNVLSLSFTLPEYVALDVNDYVDFWGERYWLTEAYQPTEKSSVEWEYELKLYGVESLLKRWLVRNPVATTDNVVVFTLTDVPRKHLDVIIDCIKEDTGDDTAEEGGGWGVGSIEGGDDNIVIDYEGTYINDALDAICAAISDETEWWIEDKKIFIGRCALGEAAKLGYGEGKGLTKIERTTADNVKFYTRLYVIGSTRNINAENYGGYQRLMLPGKASYVDVEARVAEYGIIDNAEESAFADIYPSRVSEVSNTRCITKTDDDGNDFWVFYFTSDGLIQALADCGETPESLQLAGETLRVSFTSGELSGLGNDDGNGGGYFEVNWDKSTGEFEIINVWNDGVQLPLEPLCPSVGDTFILWNMEMPESYVTEAEKALLAAAEAYNAEHCIDPAVFKVSTDWLYIRDNGVELYMGRNVLLTGKEYFGDEGRQSRITKITRKVTLPWQCDLEIGDAVSVGKMSDIEDSLNGLRITLKGSSVETYIIKSTDNVTASDATVYSSLRSRLEFLSKKQNDTAAGLITFASGLKAGNYVTGASGVYIGSGDEGNVEAGDVTVREKIHSTQFESGFTGSGFQIWESEGEWHGELDYLTVRKSMRIYELLIDKVRSVGGELYISAANGKIATAALSEGKWELTFETANEFVSGDYMLCQTWSANRTQKYYLAHVEDVSDGGVVTVSLFDCLEGSVPEAGDEVALKGSDVASRQGVIMLSATDDGEPRMDVLNGVAGSSTAGCLRARLGCLDGITDSYFPADAQPQGYGLYADNAYLHGRFILSTGVDILTQFEITEGKIASAVYELQSQINDADNLLSNGSFLAGYYAWDTTNDVSLFTGGGLFILTPESFLSTKGDGVYLDEDSDGNQVLRVSGAGMSLVQTNAFFSSLPDGASAGVFARVKLQIEYWSAGASKIGVSFVSDSYGSGSKAFSAETADEGGVTEIELAAAEDSSVVEAVGYWDGSGDFRIDVTESSSDLYIRSVKLTEYPIETEEKYATLFEQTSNLLALCAVVFDKENNPSGASGVMIKPEGSGLFTVKSDGTYGYIGTWTEVTKDGETESVIKLSADNIVLEGYTTVNGGFSIDESGYMTAQNGGTIAGFSISGEGLSATSSKISFVSGSDSLYLSSSQINFSTTGITWSAGPGATQVMTGAILAQNITMSRSVTGFGNIGIRISVDGAEPSDSNTVYGNSALYIDKGHVTGFRLRVRRIQPGTSSFELDVMDSVVIVYSTSCDITLPDDAEDGQMYFIKLSSSSNGSYKLDAGSHLINMARAVTTSSTYTFSKGGWLILVYDANESYDSVEGIWQGSYCNCD